MKYIIVFIGLFIFLNSQAQEVSEPQQENEIATEESNEQAETPAQPQVDETNEPKAGNPETANSEAGNPEIDNKTSESDFDVFRPTEDISEDLAVPFPVDI